MVSSLHTKSTAGRRHKEQPFLRHKEEKSAKCFKEECLSHCVPTPLPTSGVQDLVVTAVVDLTSLNYHLAQCCVCLCVHSIGGAALETIKVAIMPTAEACFQTDDSSVSNTRSGQ